MILMDGSVIRYQVRKPDSDNYYAMKEVLSGRCRVFDKLLAKLAQVKLWLSRQPCLELVFLASTSSTALTMLACVI